MAKQERGAFFGFEALHVIDKQVRHSSTLDPDAKNKARKRIRAEAEKKAYSFLSALPSGDEQADVDHIVSRDTLDETLTADQVRRSPAADQQRHDPAAGQQERKS